VSLYIVSSPPGSQQSSTPTSALPSLWASLSGSKAKEYSYLGTTSEMKEPERNRNDAGNKENFESYN
jgi:hypothetical protein